MNTFAGPWIYLAAQETLLTSPAAVTYAGMTGLTVCKNGSRVRVMATNLSLKNVPPDLMLEARMEALACGQTFRDWILGGIEERCGGGAVTSAGRGGVVGASPKRQRRVGGRRRTKSAAQNESLPRADAPSAPREEIVPCGHGILFHPGCNC
jgi:hypothetical protein